MSEINKQIEILGKEMNDIVEVVDPMAIIPGSLEIDEQLQRLSKNLAVLSKVIMITGSIEARCKYNYYNKKRDAMEITDEELKKVGMVKSTKDSYGKSLCAKEMLEWEEVTNKRKYLENMLRTYTEWIQVYKKIRFSN